jgi:hypothetical protein
MELPSKLRRTTSLNRSMPRPSTNFPQITSGSALFSITFRNFSFRSINGSCRRSRPLRYSRSNAWNTGLPRRNSSSLKMLRPSESRQTSSPSITASLTFRAPRCSCNSWKLLYAFRLREISSQLPSQMCASARKPSCFSSNRKSGSSNGVQRLLHINYKPCVIFVRRVTSSRNLSRP